MYVCVTDNAKRNLKYKYYTQCTQQVNNKYCISMKKDEHVRSVYLKLPIICTKYM